MPRPRSAVILHGMPSRKEYYDPAAPSMSNAHWIPWLQAGLLKADIDAHTPEVPRSFDPEWRTWVREVERFEINEGTALVGHSCGGGFWIRYLSEHPEINVNRVILVAPWLDPDHDETRGFFDFDIDPGITDRSEHLLIFNSDNDMGNVHKSVATIRQSLPETDYREFHKMGHFCEQDMGSVEFPELLEALVR